MDFTTMEPFPFFPQDDRANFLESLAYLDESWFTIQGPSNEFEDDNAGFSPFKTQLGSAAYSTNLASPPLFAPIVESKSLAISMPMPPPVPLSKRSESTGSVSSSPPSLKPSSRSTPISPQSKRRKRLARYSSEDSSASSADDDDDEDSSFSEDRSVGRMRKKGTNNSTIQLPHTSAFRGVSCCGKDRKFQARIRDGSKVHYLGRYDNEFDAAIKYDEAARTHKGDAAILNFKTTSPTDLAMLREHYFANGKTILPELHSYLYPGTAERLVAKLPVDRR